MCVRSCQIRISIHHAKHMGQGAFCREETYLRMTAPSSARLLACSQAFAPSETSIVPPVEGFGGGGLAVSQVLTTTLNCPVSTRRFGQQQAIGWKPHMLTWIQRRGCTLYPRYRYCG